MAGLDGTKRAFQLQRMAERKSKHVIFLGAGASRSSGYPVGDDLRKEWLASSHGLQAKFDAAISGLDGFGGAPVRQAFRSFIQPLEQTLTLFRQGGFASIDEFCYLLRESRAVDVRQLKTVLRLVFCLHSPELQFSKSDYYPFIQRLFRPQELQSLREDVVVMSFNYDCYLEWLLRRAVQVRNEATGRGGNPTQAELTVDSLVTSAFSLPQIGLKGLAETDGFCLLKLHGMTAWPNAGTPIQEALRPEYAYDHVFDPDIPKRVLGLLTGDRARSEPPIVFPWEVLKPGGKGFIEEENFCLHDLRFTVGEVTCRPGGRGYADPHVHSIFTGIWNRAREETQAAHKLSFVGLSMHEYLNLGFEYLFTGKTGTVDLVVTDSKAAGPGKYISAAEVNAFSPTARVLALLERCAPSLEYKQPPNFKNTRGARVRSDFADFIANEMWPDNG